MRSTHLAAIVHRNEFSVMAYVHWLKPLKGLKVLDYFRYFFDTDWLLPSPPLSKVSSQNSFSSVFTRHVRYKPGLNFSTASTVGFSYWHSLTRRRLHLRPITFYFSAEFFFFLHCARLPSLNFRERSLNVDGALLSHLLAWMLLARLLSIHMSRNCTLLQRQKYSRSRWHE